MGKSSGNTGTASFDNPRSHEHTPHAVSLPGMTTETQIIVWAAPNARGAAGPAKHHADAPTPSDTDEKPPATASKKHSCDPEAVKDAPASRKPADATEKAKKPLASKKHVKDADEAKNHPLPRTHGRGDQDEGKGKKDPVVKKPAAKQLPKKKGSAKENSKTPKLPPKRTDVLPHEEVSSESSDTDTPNPGYVSGADSPVTDVPQAPRA
ncbi:hypothetical protein PR003_g27739 [Phytophthora rubi]|uniref:Uncharacterized protein n=1 Tax=Phytophthora rubi TaxID=129364 RepID=A0A6A4BXC1_9STRA|nr:hypothetical protein PR003_g27739 [Phytophthora rubi]